MSKQKTSITDDHGGRSIARLIRHCVVALISFVAVFAAVLYLLASWAVGDMWPFDRGKEVPWESLGRLALPVTAIFAGIIGAVIAGHGQATRLEELRNDRDANVTERYTKAIEQLGNEHPAIRTGGIYALERIGQDSERDRLTINNVLYSSLFRDSRTIGSQSGTPRDMTKWEESATIVALMRLRRQGEPDRLASYLIGSVSLENADLRGSYLQDAQLARILLINADLSGANLSGANFRDAILGSANFTRATLTSVTLSNAELLDANFQDADLSGADLRGADLEGTNFSGAQLKDAIVDADEITNDRFSKKQRAQLRCAAKSREPVESSTNVK